MTRIRKKIRCDKPGRGDVHGWHKCDHQGCAYKSKRVRDLDRHKDNVHGRITCDQPGCKYQCTQVVDMTQHERFDHDIWDNVCDFCCFEKKVSNKYVICKDCLDGFGF